jgi:hypothetical protein
MIQVYYDITAVGRITANFDCTVSFVLKGGGGGGGGRDTGVNGPGTAGQLLTGSFNMTKDSSVLVAVGGGGDGGYGNIRGAGAGGGGYALDGFSGGRGGNAGPSGTSGSGGGGGGATVLYKTDSLSTTILAVAGGGAGGGGAGNKGYQDGYLLPGDQYTYAPNSLANGLTYEVSAVNGAYCTFLNTFGVWDYRQLGGRNDRIFLWDVYFTAGIYTAELSADNYSFMTIDGIIDAFDPGNFSIGSSLATPDGTVSSFNQVHAKTLTVSKSGWYKVRVYAVNYGNAAGVAFRISQGTTVILTSRSAYNLQSATLIVNAKGGQGQNHQGDGGGPGGGGGGYPGGQGGIAPIYDNGASGGTPGANYRNTAAGINPGINSGIGFGNGLDNHIYYGLAGWRIDAGNATHGTPGFAAFTSAANSAISVNTASGWVKPSSIYRRTSENSWTSFSAVYVRKDDVWKLVYGNPISYSNVVGQTYNNQSGPPQPYPAEPDTVVGEFVGWQGGGGDGPF